MSMKTVASFDPKIREYLEGFYEMHERTPTLTETLQHFQLDPNGYSDKHENVFWRVEEFEIIAPLLASAEKLQAKIHE